MERLVVLAAVSRSIQTAQSWFCILFHFILFNCY